MADETVDKDPTQAFQSRLTKMNGDAMAFATQLFDENFRLREDKRVLGEELKTAKKAAPADGAIVLSADQAKEFEAYQALGKAEELKTRIAAHETLETEVAALKKKEVIREISEIQGFKPSVLEDRDKAAGGLEFVVRQDDKKRKAAYVKDGDKETPLTEYANEHWADYLPSLKVEQGQPQLQPIRTGHGSDPRPASPNGNAVYEHSHKTLASSGKYGM